MGKKFKPIYEITSKLAKLLMCIEASKEVVGMLTITVAVLARLRETARLNATHYSTQIEGNILTREQVRLVIKQHKKFTSSERHEHEVNGYYKSVGVMEQFVARNASITTKVIQMLHGIIISGGNAKAKPTPYRDGQNVIREMDSGRIVYMPPTEKDVPSLMEGLIDWIKKSKELPAPIVAAIAHYQFATIHPYFDGNGRTARLLATMILHLRGYDLKGIYALEEYYANNLSAYYKALTVGPSHNYYMGRKEADITGWIEYLCEGMAESFEKVKAQAQQCSEDTVDSSHLLRALDPMQRKVLELFAQHEIIKSKQVADLFGFNPRTARAICKKWTDLGFITITNASRKARTYQLAKKFISLVKT